MLTRSQRRHLEYVRDHEPADELAPGYSMRMMMRLQAMRLVNRVYSRDGRFNFIKHELTEAGRAALAENTGGA